MSAIIRAARVAAEPKALPVPARASGARDPRAAAPPRAPTATATNATASDPSASGESTPAIAATYEEYRRTISEELARLRTQVTDSSRDQGLKEGRAAAAQEWSRQSELLRTMIESVRSEQLQHLTRLGDEAAEIVLVAVGKILGDAFASRSAALAAVQEAIGRCHERGRLLIRLAPGDHAALSGGRGELPEILRGRDAELVPDEQVDVGGCIVESVSGSLDARLEVQLQRLVETLRAARARWGRGEEEPRP
jgi:flagellar assembly protein FliH